MAGHLLVGTDKGVFRSSDRGAPWLNADLPPLVHRIVMHPKTSDAFAGTEAGLYRSPDAGRTWRRIAETGTNDVSGVAASVDGTRVYAAVNGSGIFRAVLTGR